MPVTQIDPSTALIVLDLQKGVAGYPLLRPMAEIVERANALSAAFRARRLPVVIVVVDASPPGRTDQPRRARDLPADFADPVADLAVEPGDIRITKQTPGAFARTGLEERLRSLGVTQVVLTGVATGTAVDATARQAYELGFNVTVALDAMTDASADSHDHAVAKVFPRIAETGSADEIIHLLTGESA